LAEPRERNLLARTLNHITEASPNIYEKINQTDERLTQIVLFFRFTAADCRCHLVVLLLEAAGVLRHALLHPPQEGQSTLVPAHLSSLDDVRFLVDRNQMGAIGIEWVLTACWLTWGEELWLLTSVEDALLTTFAMLKKSNERASSAIIKQQSTPSDIETAKLLKDIKTSFLHLMASLMSFTISSSAALLLDLLSVDFLIFKRVFPSSDSQKKRLQKMLWERDVCRELFGRLAEVLLVLFEHFKSHVFRFRLARHNSHPRDNRQRNLHFSPFSRIPCHRQLVYPRSDVHVLRLGRYRASHEQIFVVEEIPDHHSACKSRNQSRIFLVSLSDSAFFFLSARRSNLPVPWF
jgi:hypothetical protein